MTDGESTRRTDSSARVLLDRALAVARVGETDQAAQAFQEAAAVGDPAVVAEATFQLGKLAYEEGNLEGAKAYFETVVETGVAEVVPRAINGLGVVYDQFENAKQATTHYQKAIESGHSEAAAQAAWNLGLHLERIGDLSGAEQAFAQAVAGANRKMASRAALRLGILRFNRGDVEGAISAYRTALDSDEAATAADAAVNLALALAPNRLTETEEIGGEHIRPTLLTPLDEAIALHGDSPDSEAQILDVFQRSDIFALGQPAGEVSDDGHGSESRLLHFTIDADEGEQVILPVFTQLEIMQRALLRNPEWQTLSILLVAGRDLYANIDDDVTLVVNPWSRLEHELLARTAPATVP